MRALLVREFGSHQGVRMVEMPEPSPGAGEVAIRVAAAAINFPDLLVIAGKYQVRPPLPFIPGKELAGEIIAIGEGVDRFAVGDRVMAQVEYGAFGEIVVAPANACFAVPQAVPLIEAAGVGVAYQTAHFALHARAGLKKGDRVMVTGASGSVGIAAIQLARAAGAHVTGVVSRESSRAAAESAGCDATVLFADDTDRDAFREEVRRKADGDMDILVEMVGGETFNSAIRCLAWEGRAIVVGFTSGTIPQVRANYLLVKNIAVLGLQWSDYRDRDPDHVDRVQREIFGLIEDGTVRLHPPEVVPFDRFAEGFELLATRRARGKVHLDFGGAGA